MLIHNKSVFKFFLSNKLKVFFFFAFQSSKPIAFEINILDSDALIFMSNHYGKYDTVKNLQCIYLRDRHPIFFLIFIF